jgi:hypothetical protein
VAGTSTIDLACGILKNKKGHATWFGNQNFSVFANKNVVYYLQYRYRYNGARAGSVRIKRLKKKKKKKRYRDDTKIGTVSLAD